MQQRIETIADGTQHGHGYSRFGFSSDQTRRNAPLSSVTVSERH
jgi:hypothetical protein